VSRLSDSVFVDGLGADHVTVHWIPLGAGGAAVVRVSGRIYEAVRSLLERRRPCDLYHAALEVCLEGERFVIENAWPSPDGDMAARGVVLEGPVWSPRLCRLRMFRYEVRRWKDGTIPDIDHAVASPTLTNSPEHARRILEAADWIPRLTWGRKVGIAAEMWTSNSVVSYLLTVSGLPTADCPPPNGGRAPGWRAGICVGRDRAPARTLMGSIDRDDTVS
jgi:hypothetical protein